MEKPKRTFVVEPAAGWIMWGVVALLTALWLWIMIDMFHSCIVEPQWYGPFSWENENIRLVVFFGLGPLGIASMTVCTAFGSYGKVTIQDDCFEFHALFRRPKKVYYSEFNYYGIEYVMEPKAGKVWEIYFRKEKKPEKYLHKHEGGFPAKPVIKFTYREDLYESLIYYLPERMATMLKSCHSYEVFDYFKKKH